MWVGPLLNSDCSEIPRRHKVFTIIRTERDTLQKGKGPFSSVQSLSCIRLFETPWTAARQVSCLSSTPGACSNSGPLSWWCHPIISSIVPFSSCLQSFPASGSFSRSQFFAWTPSNSTKGKQAEKICSCKYRLPFMEEEGWVRWWRSASKMGPPTLLLRYSYWIPRGKWLTCIKRT